jgi:hypothetical protein
MGRGCDRAGGSVTLATCFTKLHLGAISHTILPMGVPSKDPE